MEIESVIRSFNLKKLTKTKHGYKSCCPFHNERDGSFHIVLDKGFVKCFGCGKFQPLWTFLLDNNVPFDVAVDFLLTDFDFGHKESQELTEYKLGRLLPKSWLDRGFKPETLHKYGIGYDEVEEHTTIPLYFFRKLMGIKYRKYPKEFWYSDNFDKDSYIYNYTNKDSAIVVEGETDLLRVDEHGYGELVESTLGCKPGKNQMKILSTHRNLLMAYDYDVPGIEGMFMVHRELRHTCNISVIPYKGGDPGESTKEGWEYGMDNVKSFIEFELFLAEKNEELYKKIIKKYGE